MSSRTQRAARRIRGCCSSRTLIDDILGEVESSGSRVPDLGTGQASDHPRSTDPDFEGALRAQIKVTEIGRDIAVAIINLDQTHEGGLPIPEYGHTSRTVRLEVHSRCTRRCGISWTPTTTSSRPSRHRT